MQCLTNCADAWKKTPYQDILGGTKNLRCCFVRATIGTSVFPENQNGHKRQGLARITFSGPAEHGSSARVVQTSIFSAISIASSSRCQDIEPCSRSSYGPTDTSHNAPPVNSLK